MSTGEELSGFVTGVAPVRPTKSLAETSIRSTKRKMKEKGFARSLNRNDIVRGAVELGADLNEHISFAIEAPKPVASQLGLRE